MDHIFWKPGRHINPGGGPAPFGEVYPPLRGEGNLFWGNPSAPFRLSQDSIGFVPAGILHAVVDYSPKGFELITVMCGPLATGANVVYDERKETRGSSFKIIER